MNLSDTIIGKKFRDKKIGKRFFNIFLLVILITGIGVAYLMFNMINQKGEVDSIYKVRLLSIDYLIEADRDAYQSSIAISNLINRFYENAASKSVIKKYIGDINENLLQVRSRFDNFAKLYLDSGGERVPEFAIFDAQYADLKYHTERITKLFQKDAFKAASAIYNTEYDKSFSAVRNAMDVLTEVSLKLTEIEFQSFSASFIISMILSAIIVAAIITILVLSGLFLTQSITTPINFSMIFADKIARGDFTERIHLDQKDEFGDLTSSLNKAADDLERLFSEIKTATLNVITAVEQISEGNQNLSVRTTEQASSIEQIVATLEQATATIKQNYDNTEDANKLADKTKKMADKGNTVITDAVNSIYEINESSKQIEQIIILIDKLSTQTNMLALNASIEAARAGEHGRGFAVVADEVRNLAQQSADAANKIADLIKQVTEKIDKGTNLAKQSGDSMREIVASMEKLAEIIAGLTQANSEQKIGMEQINTAVQEMDTMTQQNAALVEETAATSEELSAQAMELKQMMGKFIINEDKAAKKDI